jgi:hypothetical protein
MPRRFSQHKYHIIKAAYFSKPSHISFLDKTLRGHTASLTEKVQKVFIYGLFNDDSKSNDYLRRRITVKQFLV